MTTVYHDSAQLNPKQQRIAELLTRVLQENKSKIPKAILSLAGILLRDEWPIAQVKDVIQVICKRLNDKNIHKQLKAVEQTNLRLSTDNVITGWPTFRKIFGNDTANELETCLWPEQLPEINAGIQDLTIISPLAWDALKQANNPPHLFRYGNTLSRIESDDYDRPILRELTASKLRHELAWSADWFVESADKQGHLTRKDARPPAEVVQDMLAHPNAPLPVLYRITEAPVFAPDGILQLESGYHPHSHTYYSPCEGLIVPQVADKPSASDIAKARGLLCEMVCNFPFVQRADKANALALLLLPFARDLISGPTPNHLIEAPSPGSGKSLLADILLRPSTGHNIGILTQAQNDEELRKRITALLREGHSVNILDNVTKPLDSGTFAAVLTAVTWTDRILGQSTVFNVPVRCVWVTTANNPMLNWEIARRSIRIRLDAAMERAWLREGFKHDNLREWVDEQRGEIIWSALTLIQYWLASGKPRPKTKGIGSFEAWSYVIGGVLEAAEIFGFLENLKDFYDDSDIAGNSLRELIKLWWDNFGEQSISAADLFPLAVEMDFDMEGKTEKAQRISFGKFLAQQRDRVFDGFRVVSAGNKQRAAQWKLLCVSGEGEK